MKLTNCSAAIMINDEYGKPIAANDHIFQVVDAVSNLALIMRAETENEKKEWLDAIRKHIEYAKNYLE